MNASIVSSAVQSVNSSILPAATSAVTEAVTETMSGMSRNSKIAIGVGVGGVVIVGGVVGYKMWRKRHPKADKSQQQSQQTKPQKSLEDSDDFDDYEDEQEVLIVGGESLTKARDMVIAFVKSMANKGVADKAALMSMSAELVGFALNVDPGFEFIEEAVEAGLAASKKDGEK